MDSLKAAFVFLDPSTQNEPLTLRRFIGSLSEYDPIRTFHHEVDRDDWHVSNNRFSFVFWDPLTHEGLPDYLRTN